MEAIILSTNGGKILKHGFFTIRDYKNYIKHDLSETYRPIASYLLRECDKNKNKLFDYKYSIKNFEGYGLMWCCTFKIDQLAKKFGKSVKSINRAMKILRDDGVLIVGKKNRRVSNHNAYTFPIFAVTPNDMREIEIREADTPIDVKKLFLSHLFNK